MSGPGIAGITPRRPLTALRLQESPRLRAYRKPSPGCARPVGTETLVRVCYEAAEGSGRQNIGGMTPLGSLAQGRLRTCKW